MWKQIAKWLGKTLLQAATEKGIERLSDKGKPKPPSPSSTSR